MNVMEEIVSSRELHPPRQVVNASKDNGGAFSKFCILSDSFVLVRNNELLYTPALENKPTLEIPQTLVVDSKPVVIQSFILDVETCERLSRRNVFFALTCEFSLLVGAKVGPNAFTFNEILESFYSEVEVDQTLLDAHTSMHMTATPGLIVIGTLRRIVLVSVNMDTILDQIDEMELRSSARSTSSFSDQDDQPLMEIELSGDFVLGEKVFEIRLDDYIFLEEVRLNYTTVDEDIGAIYSPQVMEVSIWAYGESSFTVVVVGDGNWIRFMPLEMNEEEGIWEDSESVDKVNPSQPSPFVWLTDHEVWITAISKASECATIYATGDHVGTLAIWRPKPTTLQRSGGLIVYEKDFSIASATGISGASIETITQAPVRSVVDGLFIGDSSGSVVCVKVDYKNRIIENVWKMRLFTPESYPTVARWNPFETRDVTSNEKSQDDVLIHSNALGVAYKCKIHKQIAAVFNAAHGNDDVRQHKSFVEVCAILVELDALVTAGSQNSASIWRLSNGEHILTIPLPEYFVTSVAAYDVGYVVGGIARILFGFASGSTINYLVQVEDSRDKTAVSDGVGNKTSALEGSLLMNTGSEGPTSAPPGNNEGVATRGSLADDVTSVDILDEVTSEELLHDSDGGAHPGEDANGNSALVDIKIVQEEQRGLVDDAYKLAVELQNTTSYCPMPVTDIFISSLGLYFAFVFGKQQIIVHEWESHRALHQIQLDDSLVDVSVVTHRGLQDIDSDVLVLALQGPHGIKLLDALSGSIIEEQSLHFLDYEHENAPPKVSRLWYFLSETANNSPPLKDIDIFGVCGGHEGTSFSSFTKNQALTPLPSLNCDLAKSSTRQGKLTSQLEYLVLGGHGISDYASPLASLWTIRHGILMRCHEGHITRVLDYQIVDDKARVIHTSALKILSQIRANRALIVLSDGTVFVLQV